MFLDRVKISIKAGDGGDGHASFLRTKLTAKGGPDGGDGGRGGSVIFKASSNMNTLYTFRFNKKFVAGDGGEGGRKDKTGARGKDCIIEVPTGTVIFDGATEKVIADLSTDGAEFVALRGGEGGRGNAYFKSSIKQAPNYCQLGEKTEQREVILELKTIADVGLVGYPNVGKSTLLARISNANPKIANYHFTTLYPNLGVCETLGNAFVVADIPGLIEGASEGQGLGHYFLRHVERVRLILHVVDISESEGRYFLDDYRIINKELAKFGQLSAIPQLVVFNKIDLISQEELDAKITIFEAEVGAEHLEISGATMAGLEKLKKRTYEILSKLPKAEPIAVEEFDFDKHDRESIDISRDSAGVFVLSGGKIENLIRGVILDDYLSMAYFQNRLSALGIIDLLKQKGLKSGDTIRVKDVEFIYEE